MYTLFFFILTANTPPAVSEYTTLELCQKAGTTVQRVYANNGKEPERFSRFVCVKNS